MTVAFLFIRDHWRRWVPKPVSNSWTKSINKITPYFPRWYDLYSEALNSIEFRIWATHAHDLLAPNRSNALHLDWHINATKSSSTTNRYFIRTKILGYFFRWDNEMTLFQCVREPNETTCKMNYFRADIRSIHRRQQAYAQCIHTIRERKYRCRYTHSDRDRNWIAWWEANGQEEHTHHITLTTQQWWDVKNKKLSHFWFKFVISHQQAQIR